MKALVHLAWQPPHAPQQTTNKAERQPHCKDAQHRHHQARLQRPVTEANHDKTTLMLKPQGKRNTAH
jgi:hypothetical protein